MDLRQLRSFVVLAEELHFSRAAGRLGITQPSLSQQIVQLETELATTLVHRTSRQVALTPSGETLLAGARRTIAEAERALVAVHDLAAGRTARLVIGALVAGLNGPLPAIMRRLRQEHTGLKIDLRHFGDNPSQQQALLDGTLDIAVVRQVMTDRGIDTRLLLTESFLVYLPEDHRFAGRSELGLEELADETFVSWHRDSSPAFHDAMANACQAHGFTPRIESTGNHLVALLSLVAAGFGVCVHVTSNQPVTRTGVVAVPLRPTGITQRLYVAYRRWHDNPAVAAFLSCVPDPAGGGGRS